MSGFLPSGIRERLLKADEPLHELLLRYDLRGPESAGMWEPELKKVLQAA